MHSTAGNQPTNYPTSTFFFLDNPHLFGGHSHMNRLPYYLFSAPPSYATTNKSSCVSTALRRELLFAGQLNAMGHPHSSGLSNLPRKLFGSGKRSSSGL